jgi:hypothetical protein
MRDPGSVTRLTALALVVTAIAFAQPTPVANMTVTGKAASGSKQLPAEIRGVCYEKGRGEITFALVFASVAQADAFFPLGTYEGPDGKSAPMEVKLTREPKPVTFNFKSAAGWFGVHNDYLLSLRPTDTWTFLKQSAAASSISVTIVQGAKSMVMTFEKPGEAIARFESRCKK